MSRTERAKLSREEVETYISAHGVVYPDHECDEHSWVCIGARLAKDCLEYRAALERIRDLPRWAGDAVQMRVIAREALS